MNETAENQVVSGRAGAPAREGHSPVLPDELGRPGFDRRMHRDEINQLPLRSYEGPVEVIRQPERVARAIEALRRERVLGFDTETRPAYRRGESYKPALLQLAGSRKVYLFQLQFVPLEGGLAQLLSDARVIKAGVAPNHDVAQLNELAPLEGAGFEDLSELARRNGIKNYGLRGLAAVLLGFRISKQAQRSNWAHGHLTPKQVRYAATDAWVSRRLYRWFEKHAPPRKANDEQPQG